MKRALTKMNMIVHALSSIAVTGYVYGEYWDYDFRCGKINKVIMELKTTHSITKEELSECNYEDFNTLGFSRWNEVPDNEGTVLMLIPMTLYPFLPGDLEVLGFSEYDRNESDQYEYKSLDTVDTDIRCGVLAYGLLVKTS